MKNEGVDSDFTDKASFWITENLAKATAVVH